MYTANTMASAIEALGLSLPNSSAQIAIGAEKKDDARRAGEAALALLKAGLRPRDILTRKAFENAIAVVIALGGSTNAVLHLLAIAHAAQVKLTLDDFTRIGRKVPVLADLKPSGKYGMVAPDPDRRPDPADEDAPGGGAPPRGRPDGDRPHARREPARG